MNLNSSHREKVIYQNDQKGQLMIGISIFSIIVGGVFYLLLSSLIAWWICLSVALFILIFFHKLRVRVTQTELYIGFGIGLIHRNILRSSIVKAEKVKNKLWYGFGIRLTPHGFLWNIQGLDAIELTYTNGKKFRIGTDDPDNLYKILNAETTPTDQ